MAEKETTGLTEETKSFEQKLNSAKETLEILMNPDITLEQSVKAYEKGMSELAEAQKMLDEAQIKINVIKEGS